ncbi:MAG: hypothetical protein KGY80_10670 [Candidatus Thorarchaeota archaeon]|nr:hypothetical protein [Candidatus Thorarchaeota archaeon]
MVRLTTISNIIAGIGLTILGFSVILHYLLQGVSGQENTPFITWVVGAALMILVVVFSLINTFTELTGFVHPEDKLISNIFVFLMAIATILIYGIFNEAVQDTLFEMASMIVIAYVFLFIFSYFSTTITEGTDISQVKEMTSRFMLVSLLLGSVMAGLMVGLDWIRISLNSYELAAVALGAFAVGLVVVMAIALGRKYEPVGE